MERFDVVIIGGGAGGLVAASGCARFGARCALVEKDALGGDCLWAGCVPTKRLVYASTLLHRLKAHGRGAGLRGVESVELDFASLMEGVRATRSIIGRHDAPERFEKLGVEIFYGSARFVDNHTLQAGQRRLWAKKFIIATGSSPVIPSVPGLEEADILTNITALELKRLPRSMAILGAGPVGVEFAQIFRRLGAEVHMIEKMGQILPEEDEELTTILEEILKAEGIHIHTCTEITRVEQARGLKKIYARCATGDRPIDTEELMAATGRSPNVEGLGLEGAGVEYHAREGIKVDRRMRTTAPNIFACGDVAGGPAFTHVAEYEAGIALSGALFPWLRRSVDYSVVPWVVYTEPELARCGLTEAQAIERYGSRNIRVYRYELKLSDRAVIEDGSQGIIKLVCTRRQRLLGAHILGLRAGEMIHEYALAMKQRIPVTAISRTIHAYPTLSHAVKRACDLYYRERLFSGWLSGLSRWLIKRGWF